MRLVRQNIAQMRLVRISGKHVYIMYPRPVGVVLEVMLRLQADVIALLGETAAGLAVDVKADIVIEFSAKIDRTINRRIAVGGPRCLNKPMQDRQRIGQSRICYDRAQILLGIDRIGKWRHA